MFCNIKSKLEGREENKMKSCQLMERHWWTLPFIRYYLLILMMRLFLNNKKIKNKLDAVLRQ